MERKLYSCTVHHALAVQFSPGSTPRSAAYKNGFLFELEKRINGRTTGPFCPHKLATPSADAYLSGLDHAKQFLAIRTIHPFKDQ